MGWGAGGAGGVSVETLQDLSRKNGSAQVCGSGEPLPLRLIPPQAQIIAPGPCIPWPLCPHFPSKLWAPPGREPPER